MTGRVLSARSKARLMVASRIVLFHVGSCWPTRKARTTLPRDASFIWWCRARTVRCGRTTPRSTGDDRAGRPWRALGAPPACATRGRNPTASGMSCHSSMPGAVGGVVQLGARDVRVHAHHVEVRLLGQVDVAHDLFGRRVGEALRRRSVVDALDEEALAVDRPAKVAHRHAAQSRRDRAGVAGDEIVRAVVGDDEHRHFDLREVGVAERVRPPQRRLVDVDVPRDGVVSAARACVRPRGRRRGRRACTTVRTSTVSASVVSRSAASSSVARSLVGARARDAQRWRCAPGPCARSAPAARCRPGCRRGRGSPSAGRRR